MVVFFVQSIVAKIVVKFCSTSGAHKCSYFPIGAKMEYPLPFFPLVSIFKANYWIHDSCSFFLGI